MTDRPSRGPPTTSLEAVEAELASAERYAVSALAPATRKAFESDWRVFANWCAEQGQRPTSGGTGGRRGVPGRRG